MSAAGLVMPVAVMLATLAGLWLARRFEGVRLPFWADALAPGLAGGLALWLGPVATPATLLWTVALVLPLTALAAVDAATCRIPDVLSFLLILTGLGHTVIAGGAVLPVALAVALLVMLGLATDWLAPAAAVGAGDILLVAAAAAWVGLAPLLELGMIAALLLWLQFLLLFGLRLAGVLPRDGSGVAMAPALAVALAAIWLAAPG